MYTVYYDIFEHDKNVNPKEFYFSLDWTCPEQIASFENNLAAIAYAKKIAEKKLTFRCFMNCKKVMYQNTIIFVVNEDGDIIISMTGGK